MSFVKAKCFLLSSVLSSMAVFAVPVDEIPELKPGQKEGLRCVIHEREQLPEGFDNGVELGVMRLISIEGNAEYPFEAQYFISEEASQKHDLYYRDRFPSAYSFIRVADLNPSVEDSDGEHGQPLGEEQESLKQFLAYFQLVAGIPANSPDLFGYILFVDVKGLSINVSYITREGRLLGHSGLLYGKLRFACSGPGLMNSLPKEVFPELLGSESEATDMP